MVLERRFIAAAQDNVKNIAQRETFFRHIE
jgi:hypothetical protein